MLWGVLGKGRHNACGVTLTLTPLPHAPGQQVAQSFMFLLRSREALLPGWRLCDLWHEVCFGDCLVIEYVIVSSILDLVRIQVASYLATCLSVHRTNHTCVVRVTMDQQPVLREVQCHAALSSTPLPS